MAGIVETDEQPVVTPRKFPEPFGLAAYHVGFESTKPQESRPFFVPSRRLPEVEGDAKPRPGFHHFELRHQPSLLDLRPIFTVYTGFATRPGVLAISQRHSGDDDHLSIPPRRPVNSRSAQPQPNKEEGHKINNRIDAREVRLIDAQGENHGVVPTRQAMMMAEEAGLDLVEVSPDAKPPVAKILDYGKFKYQEQKKANEARKKQKVIEIKEIKMRPMIDDHDYDVKMKAVKRFFEEGDKVKVTLRFRGREMAHQELGRQLLDRVKGDTVEIAKVESEPRFEGRQIVMVLAPK
ncbi:translation initiation factor IF-3 [Aestuariivirga sp. YIM B02566]|uniref:Translation initiation factor IF-3 n=1 Tax=Taklimakanibacter albus TaxID=2800327 RepID=A0ACC5RER4_9HYPH|nr:translation initiation factor IF-3 [Aestuariivirga sp. YIM B02566]